MPLLHNARAAPSQRARTSPPRALGLALAGPGLGHGLLVLHRLRHGTLRVLLRHEAASRRGGHGLGVGSGAGGDGEDGGHQRQGGGRGGLCTSRRPVCGASQAARGPLQVLAVLNCQAGQNRAPQQKNASTLARAQREREREREREKARRDCERHRVGLARALVAAIPLAALARLLDHRRLLLLGQRQQVAGLAEHVLPTAQ